MLLTDNIQCATIYVDGALKVRQTKFYGGDPCVTQVAPSVIAPEGIPLVRDPGKPRPLFWKLAGGKGDGDETPKETAVREILEELGIKIRQEDLVPVDKESKGDHIIYYYQVTIPNLIGLRERGDGEEVQVFAPQEVVRMRDFFLPHRDAVGRVSLEEL